MIKVSERKNGSRKVVVVCEKLDSKVKQEMKDECDINKIMKRYTKLGKLPELIKQNGIYGDFADVKDFKDSLDIVVMANYQFENLPSAVRNKFKNDTALFLEFANNPKNKVEMGELGLLKPEIKGTIVEPIKEKEPVKAKEDK